MNKRDPYKLTLKKGDTIEYGGRIGIVVHAKNVDDIGVSWSMDKSKSPDIIFAQGTIKKISQNGQFQD